MQFTIKRLFVLTAVVQRTWLKIKRRQRVECVIVGYTPGKKAGFESLLVAVERDRKLCPCGSIEFGFNREERKLLNDWLQQKDRPELRCEVSFLEWTSATRRTAFAEAGNQPTSSA